MAANDKRFTRVPPESTGDRIHMVHTAEIQFSGGYNNWKIGKRYTISGNGGPTMLVHVHGVQGDGVTGHLSVHYAKQDKYDEVEPIAGQTVTDPDGETVAATVVAAYDTYIPANNIMGYDNPEYGMDVDITGSANVRFAEGLPQLDAWGKLRTSGATQLGDYVFGQEEILTSNFSRTTLAGGYVSYSDTRHSVKVGVDYTVNPTDGFSAASSNQYHHYIAGSSHLYAATALLNSPQTTGNIRRWGMFDANNGFFFLLGTGGIDATDETGFGVVIRNNMPEAAQKDTIIPRSQWNGDKLDGTGDSQEEIDLSKANIWWIDAQWHGAGRIRFGTYIDGARVVCHSYYGGNSNAYATSQTASLPTCFANKSTAASGSDLYIETWSAAVWTESDIDLRAYGSPATYASPHTTVTANVDADWQYLFSLSPEELHANGQVNHSVYLPTSISAYAHEDVTGTDAIVDIKMEVNSVHEGHAFASLPSTGVEVSTAGSNYQSGRVILQDMFRGRYESILTDTFNNLQYGAVKNFADDGGTVSNTISAITEASPAVITVSDPVLLAREPQTVTFPLNAGGYTLSGSANASYNGTFYVKPLSATTAELYTDADLTTPFDSSAAGAFTGTATLEGFYGSRVVWSFFAKTRTSIYTNPVKLMTIVNWKEIVQ